MIEIYSRIQLGEIATIKGGKRLPKGEEFSAKKTNHPYIRARAIKDGRIALGDPVYLTPDIASKLRRYTVGAGDICITIVGANIGDVGAVPRALDGANLTENAVKVVASENADQVFLKYALLNDNAKDQMKVLAGGAAQPKLGIYKVETVEITFPRLPTQRKIASILSAYDDLIDNNQRRIKILEEMAQNLYREWFVKFRFPGHENARFVDSPLGRIPEGWEVRKAPDTIDVRPITTVPKEGLKPYVPMASLSNNSMLIQGVGNRDGNSGSKFKNGDTLFARITPCLENGKIGFVQFLQSKESVGIGSTEFIVLRAKTLLPELVYLIARSAEFRYNAIKSMTGASGRQRVQEACFGKFLIAQPIEPILSKFAGIVRPWFRQVHVMAEASDTLRRTRDLLLPRLISGELDVSNLDIAIPENAP